MNSAQFPDDGVSDDAATYSLLEQVKEFHFEKSKILITGGGGFLGKALVRVLLDAGATVRTFARGAYPELEEWGCEHIRGDLTDLQSIDAAVAGMDLVFHVAGIVKPFGDPAEFDAINIQGTEHVIQACQNHRVHRLVFTSTPSVVHDGTDTRGATEEKPYPQKFLCDYFRSKAAAEKLLLASDGAAFTDVQSAASSDDDKDIQNKSNTVRT
ncbi:MAG: NAD-dependent epimerase/dehydratase family protein, partial [Deltaproteobacteria bacterium]|nr:NAD-dependent epimerase/dehydratase family protein [Deltaproteobacteria bacterium]